MRPVKKPLESTLPEVSLTNERLEKSSKLGAMPKCLAIRSSNSTQLRALTESQSLWYVRTGKPLCLHSKQSSELIFTIPRCRRRAVSKVSKSAGQTVNSALSNLHKLSAFGSARRATVEKTRGTTPCEPPLGRSTYDSDQMALSLQYAGQPRRLTSQNTEL